MVVVERSTKLRWLSVAGQLVAPAQGGEGPALEFDSLRAVDADGDHIPDAIDFVRGAKKTVLNGAEYRNSYQPIEYPWGDVPYSEGVCTDVVVRALRNAGIDLQRIIHEDVVNNPSRYPMVIEPDPFIDHRRVRTILPYFRSHFEKLSVDAADGEPFLPGDILFMDTIDDPGPEHIGIVSDHVGLSGLPLVINNRTTGLQTAELDLLGVVPVTHRFRLSRLRDAENGRLRRLLPTTSENSKDSSIDALLKRRGLSIPKWHTQMLLVTAPLWSSTAGWLRRYERRQGRWFRVGPVANVQLGRTGLARGLGKPYGQVRSAGILPDKREGDGKAPSGAFALGAAFGHASERRFTGQWPWRPVDASDYWVDDPASKHYNTWQVLSDPGAATWRSAERLSMYRLALVVEHNTSKISFGRGSAIFLHSQAGPARTTAGCTAMTPEVMRDTIAWLQPEGNPILVQVAGTIE